MSSLPTNHGFDEFFGNRTRQQNKENLHPAMTFTGSRAIKSRASWLFKPLGWLHSPKTSLERNVAHEIKIHLHV
jgi:hypothetical protein